MQQRGARAAVVHPHSGVVGREGIGPRGAGLDLHHLVVHGRLAGMEVDGVRHLRLVREMHAHDITDLDVDDRPGHGTPERPCGDRLAGCHLDGHVPDRQVDVMDIAGEDRRHDRVELLRRRPRVGSLPPWERPTAAGVMSMPAVLGWGDIVATDVATADRQCRCRCRGGRGPFGAAHLPEPITGGGAPGGSHRDGHDEDEW